MKIMVVGAGAVGGYFGARLAAAGRDVTFLVREGRAAAIRENGLRVDSPHGDLHLQPQLALREDITTPYDLIILGVKSYALDSAINDFAPAVGPGTMILPMLNGMAHIDHLVAHFGDDAVLGAACRIVGELSPTGVIRQLTGMHSLTYGDRAGGISQRILDLDEVLKGAGFEAEPSPDIVQEMWDKWVNLASLGAVTCLFRGTIGEVASVEGGIAVAKELIGEILAVAQSNGHASSKEVAEHIVARLTDPNSGLTSSMYRDMQSGHAVEAEQILGDLLSRAGTTSVPLPLLRAAVTTMRVHAARL